MRNSRPRVTINGLFLDHPTTGTGVYTREVVARLTARSVGAGAVHPAYAYTVVGHPEHHDVLARSVPYIGLEAPARARSGKLEKVIWEQAMLPLASLRLRTDLLYSPYFSLPLAALGAATALTVHDLIPLLLPDYTPSRAFGAYFRLVSAATRRADAVVTDSEHSARDIVRLLGVPRERVHVVYLGVDARYALPVPASEIEALRARYDLPPRFMLYLGGSDPRKNLGVLLRAVALLRERGISMPPLVLLARTGGRFADPRDEAARLGLGERVRFVEWVTDDEKPALYQAATAFVYPSRYEGFGLPPLEAMAGGTPVLCADSSSLPEVVGDAGLLLDPDDVETWAAAMARVCDDDALCRDLAARGQARAAQFTWDATVDGLLDVFAGVLG